MQCMTCGQDNPEQMKFCGDCGAPFKHQCPLCGFENPPDSNFVATVVSPSPLNHKFHVRNCKYQVKALNVEQRTPNLPL